MRALRGFLSGLRGLARRKQHETDLDEELRAFFETSVGAKIAAGMRPDEAARAARLELGSPAAVKDYVRDVGWESRLERVWQDVRYAVRLLARQPGFSVMAVLTLALTIGANTAIFSIADAVLFRPLPYADPDRLFVVRMLEPATGRRTSGVPYDYIRVLEELHPDVITVGLRGPTFMMAHTANDAAEWVETFSVTADYFQSLGVRPHRGRLFDGADGESGRVVVISHEAWQRRFGGDESILGRTAKIGPSDRDIVGVLPPGFLFPSMSQRHLYSLTGRPDFITAAPPPVSGGGVPGLTTVIFGNTAVDPIVRLRPGATRAEAQQRLDALAAGVKVEHGLAGTAVPVFDEPRALLFPTGGPVMLLLLGAAGVVLIIGCANLARMLIARKRQREHELGVRIALGATRLRIVRAELIEGSVLAVAGAVSAVAATTLGFEALSRQVPQAAYGVAAIGVDGRVAAFSLMLGLLAAVLFAALPAWRSAGLDVQPLLRRPRGRHDRSIQGQALTSMQVAMAIVLVCGAGLALRELIGVLRVPLGFDPQGVVTLTVNPMTRDPHELKAFYVRAVEALAARPDVQSAGASRALPLVLPGANEHVQDETGQSSAAVVHILPGFFETAGMRLMRGRWLTRDDLVADAGAAVISESAAMVLFPDREALGATFTSSSQRPFHVVGVTADVQMSLERHTPPPVYVMPSTDARGMTLLARVRAPVGAALMDIRREVSALAPGSPVTARWWSDTIAASTPYRSPRFQALVLGGFAGLALGLTALGIFGTVAFLVASRRREMGLRMALGATPASLVRLVVRQAFAPIVIGVILGVAGVYWLKRVAQAQLAGLDTRDPLTLAAAVIIVIAAAVIAAYFPARHASRVDPALVLRAE